MTPEERYDTLVETLLGHGDVTLGSTGKKGFGSSALQIGGKIFAMLSNGRLVVKLPRQRVNALVAAGAGERFDPRHDGRLMKEWLSVGPTAAERWLPLAREAMEFVASTR
jgi:TfoX/Sxy family transcriptional regulator of competence genes